MVERQLRSRGIGNERVLAAMAQVPREEFVPLDLRVRAYADTALAIGFGQTISQPYMTARMAEVLELRGHETVLEIGAGCGYAAAVLGLLAARVIAIEIVEPLAELARRNLQRTGRAQNISIISGDGSGGCAQHAPYDAISVAAGAPAIPPALVEQLRDPGVLAIPVGAFGDQELRVLRKREGSLESRVAGQCRFVPLRGSEGWR